MHYNYNFNYNLIHSFYIYKKKYIYIQILKSFCTKFDNKLTYARLSDSDATMKNYVIIQVGDK